jgi:hypothetical protein
MTCPDHAAKRACARELRLAGWSRAQISREVGVRNHKSLDRWLSGLPAPDWTRRPRAKDSAKAAAVRLRREGKTFEQIRQILRVSKSSLSLWLRDVALTLEQRALLESNQSSAPRRRGATNRARKAEAIAITKARAAEEIASVSEQELFVMGAILYWAEGAKAKPWRVSEGVSFTNSDPRLVKVYLRWLEMIGVGHDRLAFRLSIHESADVLQAESFWRGVIDQQDIHFQRPQVKAHVPQTNRRNTGDDYHGCLIIRVARSTELNRRIEGWVDGIVTSLGRGVTAARRPLAPSGLGSNPGAPATRPGTLFESARAYDRQRVG